MNSNKNLDLARKAFPYNEDQRVAYMLGLDEGYDQAMKDIQEQVEKSVIEKSNGEVTIEDLVAYNQGFKAVRELTKQDFMEKAEDAISMISRHYVGEDYTFDQIWEQFKNYMQDESEN